MNKTNSHQSDSNDIICPSCKRFVGAHDTCQYCGTGIKKRISLRFLRYSSLVIAIVGLVCLQLMAMHRETPVKSIASIDPTMNFGYITVVGKATVERFPAFIFISKMKPVISELQAIEMLPKR